MLSNLYSPVILPKILTNKGCYFSLMSVENSKTQRVNSKAIVEETQTSETEELTNFSYHSATSQFGTLEKSLSISEPVSSPNMEFNLYLMELLWGARKIMLIELDYELQSDSSVCCWSYYYRGTRAKPSSPDSKLGQSSKSFTPLNAA